MNLPIRAYWLLVLSIFSFPFAGHAQSSQDCMIEYDDAQASDSIDSEQFNALQSLGYFPIGKAAAKNSGIKTIFRMDKIKLEGLDGIQVSDRRGLVLGKAFNIPGGTGWEHLRNCKEALDWVGRYSNNEACLLKLPNLQFDSEFINGLAGKGYFLVYADAAKDANLRPALELKATYYDGTPPFGAVWIEDQRGIQLAKDYYPSLRSNSTPTVDSDNSNPKSTNDKKKKKNMSDAELTLRLAAESSAKQKALLDFKTELKQFTDGFPTCGEVLKIASEYSPDQKCLIESSDADKAPTNYVKNLLKDRGLFLIDSSKVQQAGLIASFKIKETDKFEYVITDQRGILLGIYKNLYSSTDNWCETFTKRLQ